MRNRFYAGYLHVPAYCDEPEQYVKGIHEALIDENTFNTVQDILDGKRKKQPKLQQQADKLTERIQSVQDKYFDGEITKEEKIEAVERYTAEQNELKNQTSDMPLLR